MLGSDAVGGEPIAASSRLPASVSVSNGKLPGLVRGDQAVSVPRIANLHSTGFNDVPVDFSLTGPKDRLAVCVLASNRQGLDERELGLGKLRKRGLIELSHFAVLNRASIKSETGNYNARDTKDDPFVGK